MSQDEIAIRQVTSDVWTFSRPFTVSGLLPVGGRSTALKLKNGDIWVLASTPLTEETKTTLDKLGPVKYIVSPNTDHHFFLAQYAQAYPNAKIAGVRGHPEKIKKKGIVSFVFTGVYGSIPAAPDFGFESEVSARYFPGHKLCEVAFMHKESRTLIVGDLIFNLPATEQFSRTKRSPKVPIFGTLKPHDRAHRFLTWLMTGSKEDMIRDVRAVANWDFDRIIPCHGDVIETGGKAAWAASYSSLLG